MAIMTTAVLSAQQNKVYQFLGTVNVKGKKAKNVVIKAFDSDTCFSKYTTSSNGKFYFGGEAEKHFILQFEKEGFEKKQVIVNTNNINHLESKIKKYRFTIHLTKKSKTKSDGKNLEKVDVIEINNIGKKFTYRSNKDKEQYLLKGLQLVSR